tara:strand:+ start:255 stop:461 length:207 start_codon:yes stop_codon:yes gene_type:complete
MDSHIQSVTRYRVTLDFTVNINNCATPDQWNWEELLELNDKNTERIKELYVENLGEIAISRATTKEAY